MALLTATGTFTARTTTGTQAFTGLGFQPKLIIFRRLITTSSGDDFQFGLGAAAADGQWAIFGFSEDNVSTSDTSRYVSKANCLSVLDGSGVRTEADLQSFDSDGFTLNYTTASSAYGFTYHAFGGSDLDVSVGTVPMPNTITTFGKTGLSFQPKAVQVATVYTGTQDAAVVQNFINLGAATSSSDQFSVMVGDRDNATTTDAYRYQSNLSILKRGLNSGGAVDADISFTSMNSDGFTLTTDNPVGGAQDLPYIAWGGNINVAKTRLIQPATNTTQSITGLGFQPSFTFSYDVSATTAEDALITSPNGALGFGFSDGSASLNTFGFSQDSVTTSNADNEGAGALINFAVNNAVSGTATYANTSDGYDLTWTNNDGNMRVVYGLSIGAVAGGTLTITETAGALNLTSQDPAIDFTGLVAITESTSTLNTTSNDATITLTATLTIEESAGTINLTGLDPTVTLTPPDTLVITESSQTIDITGYDPTITFSGTLTIEETNQTINFTVRNPVIQIGAREYTQVFVGIEKDYEFTGTIKQYDFVGIITEAQIFSGTTKAATFLGVTK